jgi:hypothetical protein
LALNGAERMPTQAPGRQAKPCRRELYETPPTARPQPRWLKSCRAMAIVVPSVAPRIAAARAARQLPPSGDRKTGRRQAAPYKSNSDLKDDIAGKKDGTPRFRIARTIAASRVRKLQYAELSRLLKAARQPSCEFQAQPDSRIRPPSCSGLALIIAVACGGRRRETARWRTSGPIDIRRLEGRTERLNGPFDCHLRRGSLP